MKKNKNLKPDVVTLESSPVDTPDLNPKQFEAVCHTGGHLLVFAGAGSGKTRVLTSRIAFLIKEKGVCPSEILAVTFTNKAAREMRERVEMLVPDKISGIWLGTFHSICARILRSEIENLGFGYKGNFVIYDNSDQKRVLKTCIADMGMEETSVSPEIVMSLIDRFKRGGDYPPSRDSFESWERNIAPKIELMHSYDIALKNSNALDFNDLLLLAMRLFGNNREILEKYRKRFSHILVDEYQDTNRIQYQLVKMLGENNADVFAVGDDSQSIYGWRGAEVKNILEFSNNFPGAKEIKLDKNYRSTSTILEASNALISENQFGVKKNMWTDGEKGEPLGVYEARNEFDEADFVVSKIKSLVDSGDFKPEDFAVLYRTNAKSRLLEERFSKESGISCELVGALSFYARAEIKDLVSYLRLIVNPSDNMAAARIINTPPRGIGTATVEEISRYASANDVSIMEAARRAAKGGFLKKRAADAVEKFVIMMDELSEFSLDRGVFDVLGHIIEKSGYKDFLKNDEDKLENMDGFLNSAQEYDNNPENIDGFQGFVEGIALASDTDAKTDGKKVKLMTLHASKGLEFPVVFIAGVNQNLIPLSRTDDIEEERRLFYVGMTRAMKRLFLCYPVKRNLHGITEAASPSPFFGEIPKHLKADEHFVSIPVFEHEEVRVSGMKRAVFALPDGDSTESSVSQQSVSICAGIFVLHKKFGRGQVVKVEGSGPKATVTVVFRSAGKKRLLASYLKPL